jgi:DNA polymerase (family 10)
MELGVAVARRAWCSATSILNTKHWKDIEDFRKQKIKVEKRTVME